MYLMYLTNSLQVHRMFDNLVVIWYLLLIDGKVEQWRLHNDKVTVKLWTIQSESHQLNIKFKKHWITLAYIWQRLHFVDDVLEYGSHSNQRISSSPIGQFVGPLSHKRIICVCCLHTFLSLLNLIQTVYTVLVTLHHYRCEVVTIGRTQSLALHFRHFLRELKKQGFSSHLVRARKRHAKINPKCILQFVQSTKLYVGTNNLK